MAPIMPAACVERISIGSLLINIIKIYIFWSGEHAGLVFDYGGRCSDERGRPSHGTDNIPSKAFRGYYQFHVKQNNYIYPQNMLY